MSEICLQVGEFADGELPVEAADAFRRHLPECAACRAELGHVLQLGALAGQLAAAGSAADLSSAGGPRSARPPAAITDLGPARRRGRVVVAAVVATAMAASLAVVLRERGHVSDGGGDGELAQLAAGRGTRVLPSRLSRPEVAAHRPYDVALGQGAPPSGGAAGNELLAALERRGDFWALGDALLVEGDAEGASRWLARAEQTAPVLADRGAAELALHHPELALQFLDQALAAAPGSRSAQWNRALVLQELGLRRSAAVAFAGLAAAGEPGWSDEAAAQQARLARPAPAASPVVGVAPSAGAAAERAQAARLLQAGSAQAALPLLQRAFFLARGAADAPAEEALLGELAAAARAAGSPSLAGAYASELELRRSAR